jgi:hypothetical protein
MKQLLQITFLIVGLTSFGQEETGNFKDGKVRVINAIGFGGCSLNAVSILEDIHINYKNHDFNLHINANLQVGESRRVSFDYILGTGSKKVRYNDKFLDFSLMYGRTYRKKKTYLGANIGGGYVLYIDKEYNNPALFATTSFNNAFGLSGQAYAGHQFNPNLAVGVKIFGNYNSVQSIIGGALFLSIGGAKVDTPTTSNSGRHTKVVVE